MGVGGLYPPFAPDNTAFTTITTTTTTNITNDLGWLMRPTFYNCTGIVRACTLTHKHALTRFQPNSHMILEYVLENRIRFVLELHEPTHSITHTYTTQERFSHDFISARESCECAFLKKKTKHLDDFSVILA